LALAVLFIVFAIRDRRETDAFIQERDGAETNLGPYQQAQASRSHSQLDHSQWIGLALIVVAALWLIGGGVVTRDYALNDSTASGRLNTLRQMLQPDPTMVNLHAFFVNVCGPASIILFVAWLWVRSRNKRIVRNRETEPRYLNAINPIDFYSDNDDAKYGKIYSTFSVGSAIRSVVEKAISENRYTIYAKTQAGRYILIIDCIPKMIARVERAEALSGGAPDMIICSTVAAGDDPEAVAADMASFG
jgi:hypothetical protein